MFQSVLQLLSGDDGEAGGDTWILLTWTPQLLCGLMYVATAVLFSLPSRRLFCMRHYDALCATTIVFSCAACVATYVLVETRRARFQSPDYPNIRWGIDYSAVWPRRTCADADPAHTWAHPPRDSINSNGCNNLVLSGGAFSLYVHLNLLPLIYRLRAGTAARVAAANGAVLAAAVAAVGSAAWTLASALACLLAAGGLAAHLCRRRAAAARRQFAVDKGVRRAAEQSGNLLYTLIPRNVVERLAAAGPAGGMLGHELQHATVMFCSLEPQVGLSPLSALSLPLSFSLSCFICLAGTPGGSHPLSLS